MDQKEKALLGLACCVSDPEGHRNCDMCPYAENAAQGHHCQNRMHDDAYKVLKPSVTGNTAEQFKWERDMALKQLEEIGKSLGSKIDDIVLLMRKTRPTAPYWLSGKPYCGECGNRIPNKHSIRKPYCPSCGVPVMWTEN